MAKPTSKPKPPARLPSPSPYSDEECVTLIESLNAVLADGLALYAAVYFAHRNLSGEDFFSLHRLFGKFAEDIASHNDTIAEFVTFTLGGRTIGTAEQVAQMSRLKAYPTDIDDGIEHAKAIFERAKAFVAYLHEAAVKADEAGAPDALDLVTQAMRGVQKYAGMVVRHTVDDDAGADEGEE